MTKRFNASNYTLEELIQLYEQGWEVDLINGEAYATREEEEEEITLEEFEIA